MHGSLRSSHPRAQTGKKGLSDRFQSAMMRK